MKRRNFLKGASGLMLATPFLSRPVWALEAGKPLPVPDVMDVDGLSGNLIEAMAGGHDFGDGGTTKTLGYSQDYLGPVLRMKRGQGARIDVRNRTKYPVTAHWHGLHVDGAVDGGPQTAFGPGETWSPLIEIDQPAATYWYHSHVHGATAGQVYAGLAGVLIVDDPEADTSTLPSSYGVDDLTLVVQDKAFNDDGGLVYLNRGPSMMHGFRAGEIVVNGAVRPVASVPAGMTRLRIVNASNARIYHFRFEDDRPIHQIASDAGMLPAPVRLSKLTLAPAERAEVLVDFADAKRVRLLSGPDANDPMAGGMMRGMMGRMMGGMVAPPEAVNDDDEFEVLTFEVDAAKTVAITAVPERLAGAPLPSYGEPVRRRQFRLDMHTPGGGMMGGMGINGKSMDMARIDEAVRLGETELWQVTANEMAHPFHIHGTSFQIVSHNGAAVDPLVSGMKDVVLVAGTAELLVRFDRVATRDFPYMYHCHILEHEDAGMMGQFTVS